MQFQALTEYGVFAFGSLVAVLNPLATVPPFLAMTESNTVAERRQMARRACALACCILLVFVAAGVGILTFFGVSMGAFQIAGGLVLVRVALELLQGSRAPRITHEEREEGIDKDDVSVTPLAVPVLCGPATIATAILVRSEGADWGHGAVLAATIVAIYGATFGVLLLVSDHAHRLGPSTIKVTSRLMGLMLASVAVEFVVRGVRAVSVVASG